MKTILVIMALLFVACAKPDATNLEEKRNREIEVENENLNKKAKELEADLEKRQRLFTAMKGTFEGNFSSGDLDFKLRMTLVPSLPPYESGRVRTVDEVTMDLNNLYFTVQTITISRKDNTVIAGCIFSQIRPDYDGGQVNAASENCYSIFMVSIYDSHGAGGDLNSQKPGVPQSSQEMARKIFAKEIPAVDELFVEIKPSMSPNSFLTVLKRIQP